MPRYTIGIVMVIIALAAGYVAWMPAEPDAPQSTVQEPRKAAPQPMARKPGAKRGGEGRCPDSGKLHPLMLMRGQETIWEKPSDEVMKIPGTVTVERGRHAGEPGLPVSALLPDDGGRMLEIMPCRGEPVRLMIGELADQPNRYMIVRAPRGMLKLMDYSKPDSGDRILAKNLYAVRLRALGHEGPRHEAP
ncbi:MAG: hypothetical protein R8K46_08975 [Mariprofundaceae bacterium]